MQTRRPFKKSVGVKVGLAIIRLCREMPSCCASAAAVGVCAEFLRSRAVRTVAARTGGRDAQPLPLHQRRQVYAGVGGGKRCVGNVVLHEIIRKIRRGHAHGGAYLIALCDAVAARDAQLLADHQPGVGLAGIGGEQFDQRHVKALGDAPQRIARLHGVERAVRAIGRDGRWGSERDDRRGGQGGHGQSVRPHSRLSGFIVRCTVVGQGGHGQSVRPLSRLSGFIVCRIVIR